MTELTIEITNYCPHSCPFCSSNATPEGKHLDFSDIEKFLFNNVPKGKKVAPFYNRINISGGEPPAHPDFWKIKKLCDKLAKEVHVYTNEIEYLEFNSNVLKKVHISGNVCVVPGHNAHIPTCSFQVKLLKFIPQGRGKGIKDVKVSASRNLCGTCPGNCGNLTLLSSGEVVPSPCRKEETQ